MHRFFVGRATSTLSAIAMTIAKALFCVAVVAVPDVVAQSIAVAAGTQQLMPAEAGQLFTVPITIDVSAAATITVTSVGASLDWNPARLALQSLSMAHGGQVDAWTFTPSIGSEQSGHASFVASGPAVIAPSMVIGYATFLAKQSGGTSVRVSLTSAAGSGADNVLTWMRPRSLDVCVGTVVHWGDVNDDNATNIIDAQQIARSSVGLTVSNPAAVAQRGDVNIDGLVSIIDGQQIARYATGMTSTSRVNVPFVYAPPATALTLTPSTSLTLAVRGSAQVTGAASAGGTDISGCAPLAWSSSNTSVAVVNASGFVTGLAQGTAVITAKANTETPSASLTVTVGTVTGGGGVPEAGTFVKGSVSIAGTSYPYQIFVPLAYTASKPTPAVVFIAGSGERGTDGNIQTQVGLGPYVLAHATTFPALVVFPQLPVLTGFSSYAVYRQVVIAALNKMASLYNVDPLRTYITGMSLGAGVTFDVANVNPSRFAAIVAVSMAVCDACILGTTSAVTGESYPILAQTLRAVPLWIFHGGSDPSAPVTSARLMRDTWAAAGGTVRYTEYPGAGHAIWDTVYATVDLWEWLFAQHR